MQIDEIKQIGIPDAKVLATPTKDFFVKMLTRDIDLLDAIMDLIDNCVDGVHRMNKPSEEAENRKDFYKGFFVDINLSDHEFSIVDNCGGIPLNVAKEYAFKMGRSPDYHNDDDIETVGMYGIGMKRSIFKMGVEAQVISWNENNYFKVSIPPVWFSLANDWYFDFENLDKPAIGTILKQAGTCIQIKQLHDPIKKQFSPNSTFIRNLEIGISEHYGFIIQEGLVIKINGKQINSAEINVYSWKGASSKEIKPYVYSDTIGEVSIEIIIGFYRRPATQDELDNELTGLPSASSKFAGITVICNDRVVLHNDKTLLTGWGEAPVPKYHTQFINITGVVHFRSSKPIQLPVTTTKRGLDTSSELYSIARVRIREGLKFFTDFTNRWKTRTEERDNLFSEPKKINALAPGFSKLVDLISLNKPKKNDTGSYQIPELPKPTAIKEVQEVPIRYSKAITKVQKVAEFYLGNRTKVPNAVGEWCFDQMLSQIENEDYE